jgi:hypothetical protein
MNLLSLRNEPFGTVTVISLYLLQRLPGEQRRTPVCPTPDSCISFWSLLTFVSRAKMFLEAMIVPTMEAGRPSKANRFDSIAHWNFSRYFRLTTWHKHDMSFLLHFAVIGRWSMINWSIDRRQPLLQLDCLPDHHCHVGSAIGFPRFIDFAGCMTAQRSTGNLLASNAVDHVEKHLYISWLPSDFAVSKRNSTWP